MTRVGLPDATNMADYQDTAALLAMQMTPGLGSKRINRLVAGASAVGHTPLVLLEYAVGRPRRSIPMLDSTGVAMLKACDRDIWNQAIACISRALRNHIRPVSILDSAYPADFKRCLGEAAPPLVFMRGNLALLAPASGAVVGTRAPTQQGVSAARRAAAHIVDAVGVMTSGGAAGVDWAAHDAALGAGGQTIIMLPQGILTYTLPKSWQGPFDAGQVLLLSESLPEAPWQTHAAVSRNALISARAQIVCVVEPRKQGGSILTLRHALRQNKPVYVRSLAAVSPEFRAKVQPLKVLSESVKTLDLQAIRQQESHNCQSQFQF